MGKDEACVSEQEAMTLSRAGIICRAASDLGDTTVNKQLDFRQSESSDLNFLGLQWSERVTA